MPMYYFHLYDDVKVLDDDGTNLIDLAAARDHAAGVAPVGCDGSVCRDGGGSMSVLGQKQTSVWHPSRSVLLPKADIGGRQVDVR
jgi:hypothetical protein